MKRTLLLSAIFFVFIFSTVNAKTIVRSDIDINYFYYSLDPYGEWIEIGYDDFVWRPYKSDYSWRPYSDGRWEWTRNGWYWVSYEPFGWATYHYGRWFYDDYYGWLWMPDNVWAPAWVEWRYNDNYIGWAPLPPYAKFNPRTGIYFSIGWNSGYVYWNFVKYNHFVSYNVHNHFVDKHYVKNVFHKTKYRTNYFAENDRVVNGGISRRFVENKIGRKLNTKSITRSNNFNDYYNNDVKKRKNIVDYKPSESKIKSAEFNRNKVIKGKDLKSLRTDKVVINRRSVDKNKNDLNFSNDRNGTIKKDYINKSNSEKRNPVLKRNSDNAKNYKINKGTKKSELKSKAPSKNINNTKRDNYSYKKNDNKNSASNFRKSNSGVKNESSVKKSTNTNRNKIIKGRDNKNSYKKNVIKENVRSKKNNDSSKKKRG